MIEDGSRWTIMNVIHPNILLSKRIFQQSMD
jgi:hypothetical protein